METTTAAQILDSSNVENSAPSLADNGISLAQPQYDCLKEALRLQEHARTEAEKDIAAIKAKGHPIYYSQDGRLVRENADGRKYYFEAQPDGTDLILGEVE
jgi:hypothetical protein